MTFEQATRRRILQTRKVVDEDRFQQAVAKYREMYVTPYKHEAVALAVACYGRSGIQAMQEECNRERRERYRKHRERLMYERYRITVYKALLCAFPGECGESTHRLLCDNLQRVESAILEQFGILKPLPPQIIRKLNKPKQEDQEKQEPVDEMELFLSGL